MMNQMVVPPCRSRCGRTTATLTSSRLTAAEAERRYQELGYGTAFAGRSPAAYYLPRDFFFCFFTFKLTIGAFAPVPRDTGLAAGCFFDFPAMPVLLNRVREATDDPTLQAVADAPPVPLVVPLAKSAHESRPRVRSRRGGWGPPSLGFWSRFSREQVRSGRAEGGCVRWASPCEFAERRAERPSTSTTFRRAQSRLLWNHYLEFFLSPCPPDTAPGRAEGEGLWPLNP